MPKESAVTLSLKNSKGGADDRAPLREFAAACKALDATLKSVARCLGQSSAAFSISGLNYGSAVIEVEPSVISEGQEVVRVFADTVTALEEGRELDERLDFAAIENFNRFSGLAKSRDVALNIGPVQLTEHYAYSLASLLLPANPSHGSVSGRLEAVLLHRENRFTIYPPIPGEKVDCRFRAEDLPRVISAIGKHITVIGKLYFAARKAFPVRAEVLDFEVSPPDDDLPSLLDAKGIIPQQAIDAHLPTDAGTVDEWQ
ncbi:MAG: hypothetical protein CMJ58_15250 [Planctomycetaceae bacterium]|nr:hypothetical protein [Planctomycetaceae bacterium]